MLLMKVKFDINIVSILIYMTLIVFYFIFILRLLLFQPIAIITDCLMCFERFGLICSKLPSDVLGSLNSYLKWWDGKIKSSVGTSNLLLRTDKWHDTVAWSCSSFALHKQIKVPHWKMDKWYGAIIFQNHGKQTQYPWINCFF